MYTYLVSLYTYLQSIYIWYHLVSFYTYLQSIYIWYHLVSLYIHFCSLYTVNFSLQAYTVRWKNSRLVNKIQGCIAIEQRQNLEQHLQWNIPIFHISHMFFEQRNDGYVFSKIVALTVKLTIDAKWCKPIQK